ncbi:hypothetical protein M9H77_20694 [Catharanthus roseus]|uniref:Uncharacterized protein n=1 Tax=Catharanthus roseus TaxID=4058 RepID=A0ACC0ALA5_CATRO|nr:hypothetical protein M9H77_20694 [Catharanthus roseus]
MAAVGVEVENNAQRERVIISDNAQREYVFVITKVFRVLEWRTVEKAPPNNEEDIHTPVNPVIENIVTQWHSSQWFSSARYDYTQFGAFLDMGSSEQIDDLIESGTIRLLDWNDLMTDIQLDMRFVDKVQAISTVQKWSIQMGREYRVHQNKHRNIFSKFISRSISYLVTNNLEMLVSNVIQETQMAWYAQEFIIERVSVSRYLCTGHIFARNVQKNIPIKFLSGRA